MVAYTDDVSGCITDEFHLNLLASHFSAAGDTIWLYMSNQGGNYSDHYIRGLWYDGAGADIQGSIKYQTYTDFTDMPSGSGSMNYLNFKPNGNATQLAGDWDWLWFFYDYDQNVATTVTGLQDWKRWLWNNVGIRGFRMDAVKHFDYAFVGNLLDNLHDNSIDPGMVVGEFYDGNSATLKGWVDNVLANMDADTKAAITPRVFDFSLRSALEAASDQFGNDVRNIFTASIVDAQSASGSNVVTFTDNHDFRDEGQPIDNDPILAYAYILTNNQVGLPSVYYKDYYDGGLEDEINVLISLHKNYTYGASQRDYLSSNGTSYSQTFTTGLATTTLFYQLNGGAAGKDVLVAINYAGEALDVTHEVNTGSMNISNGDTLVDMVGYSSPPFVIVDGSNNVQFEIPSRGYTVWVEGAQFSDTETVNNSTTTYNFNESADGGNAHDVNMTFTALSGSGDVNVRQRNYPPADAPGLNVCGYYWEITAPAGITSFTADLTFHYTYSDALNYTESAAYFGIAKFNSSTNTWQWLGGTVDAANNTVSVSGVDSFSKFALYRRIFGDVTGDGYVDAADLQRLGDCWHSTNSGEFTAGTDARFFNFNKNTDGGNQVIDAADLQVFGDCWHNGVEPGMLFKKSNPV